VSTAELIVVVDDGLVVGSGTHDELLQTCEAYREFADSQSVSAGER
jgi:ATP-binding cassette subfamily B protein/ATP-binding cassette subfamily C protein